MATTTAEKIARFAVDADLAHQIVHGDAETTVETENGPVPSLAKAVGDLEEEASGAADVATTKAGEASTSADAASAAAVTATAQADIATTKAGEAEAAAAAASGYAGEAGEEATAAAGAAGTAVSAADTAVAAAGAAGNSATESSGYAGEAGDAADAAEAAAASVLWTWRGAWAVETAYVPRDLVHHAGSAWLCSEASTGDEPGTAPAKWGLLALKGEDGEDGADGEGDVNGPAGAIAGHFPLLDATGKNLSDSGVGPDDFATAAQGEAADTAVQPDGLAAGLAGKSDTDHEHDAAVASGAAGFMTGTDKAKLDGIASGATANSSDSELRDRSSHSGTQAISTVSGLQDALDALIPATEKGMADGVATLDAGGKVPASQLPAIAVTDTFPVASQVAMLALDAQMGDVAVRTDISKSFILAGDDPSDLGDWQELLTPVSPVQSVNGQTGTVVLTAAHIGFTPSGGISATTVAGAIQELDAEKAPVSHTHGSSGLDNDAVTDQKLRNSVAVSVIGRSANSTGDPGDIAAASNGHILGRSSNQVLFAAPSTFGLVETGRQVATSGLASGGGDLSTNRTINVPKADAAAWRALNDDTLAVTPKAAADGEAFLALTYASTVAFDQTAARNRTLTLAGNATMGAPSAVVPGTGGVIRINNPSTYTLGWNVAWKRASGGAAPTLPTNAISYVAYVAYSTSEVIYELLETGL